MSEHLLQPEVHVVITQLPGVDGISSPARLAQIESDLSEVLGRPVVAVISDLADVDTDGANDGDTLMLNNGVWEPGTPVTSVSVADATWSPIVPNARILALRWGVTAATSGPGGDHVAYIQADFAGTGTANTVSRSDHRHTQPLPTRVTTAPQGYLSGGSQSLGSTSVTLPDGIPCIIEAKLTGQFRGAETGAAYYTLSINIGGNTFTSPGGTGGFWCVQGVPDKIQWEHEQKITGTGTAVPVSASVAWHSGSGFNIDRTYLTVTVRRDR